MGYKRTNHKNALFKLVREKGLILQTEAAKRLNRDNSGLKTTADSLVEEGKIKRQKVKQRFKNGNLNDCWLLYMPGTSQNLILNYEMELINKPFVSPLKEHHCYNKINNVEKYDITEVYDQSNVIDMHEYIKINDYDLAIKEYQGKRIITVYDIANLHAKPVKKVNEVFKNNQQHFILNEDYYIIDKQSKALTTDFKNLFTSNRQQEAYLFTESGYLMLAKPFKDDVSWKVQRSLVNTYFKMKQLTEQNNNLIIPTGQIQSLDIMEMMIQEMKKDRERIDNLENKIDSLVRVLSS